ncbi:MAG: sigma-70 family RNA polymerase sigma factor [bacterium]|nr:sigma-70 family RNA polymerase sigma factor [bacterium]
MSQVTQILLKLEQGDPQAAERLLPLVYDELRKLASAKLARESAGHTLQPTALVHEAYLRLVDQDAAPAWNSRGHFFGAAAQAMRRILVESARRRQTAKAGGGMARVPLEEHEVAIDQEDERLLALHEALSELQTEQPQIAQLVELRYFGGLTIEQAADALGVSTRTANRYWVYAKAWLTSSIQ